jgi:hypothetical protein
MEVQWEPPPKRPPMTPLRYGLTMLALESLRHGEDATGKVVPIAGLRKR